MPAVSVCVRARRTAVPAALLGEIFRRADKSSQCAGGDDSGRTQIHERVAIAHAALEITIGRADRGLALLHQTATQADAGAATRRQRNCARAYQSLPITSWTRTALGLRRSPGRDKIRRHRQRVRPWRASLRQRHANLRSARSRTTANTPSEWAHVFVPFPAATPSSSLHWARTHAGPPSPDRAPVRSRIRRRHPR